jgi:hypothetical protein
MAAGPACKCYASCQNIKGSIIFFIGGGIIIIFPSMRDYNFKNNIRIPGSKNKLLPPVPVKTGHGDNQYLHPAPSRCDEILL